MTRAGHPRTEEIIDAIVSGKRTPKQICYDFGVHRNTFYEIRLRFCKQVWIRRQARSLYRPHERQLKLPLEGE